MADIELVIKIPEEDYQNYLKMRPAYPKGVFCYIKAIQNGTPLPKNYGRLISADSLIKAIEEKAKRLSNADTINGLCGAVALIFDAPTVIEADKESDEEE